MRNKNKNKNKHNIKIEEHIKISHVYQHTNIFNMGISHITLQKNHLITTNLKTKSN